MILRRDVAADDEQLVSHTLLLELLGHLSAQGDVCAGQDGESNDIDVFLKGTISEVATRRSDFSAIMRNQGFDALIAAIDDKVRKLRAE